MDDPFGRMASPQNGTIPALVVFVELRKKTDIRFTISIVLSPRFRIPIAELLVALSLWVWRRYSLVSLHIYICFYPVQLPSVHRCDASYYLNMV